MTAVNDASGSGYWVITQFTDNFYAFKVTTTGVSSTPVKSTVGPSVPTFGYRRNAIGYIKASPNGKKIAVAHLQNENYSGSDVYDKGAAYIYDFDSVSGMVFNPTLLVSNVFAYGVEFSNCKSTTSFVIDVFDIPKPTVATNITNLNSCDNTSVGTDTDVRVVFDLTQRAAAILNGQSATQFSLSFFRDATFTQSIAIPVAYQNTNATETIYVKMVNMDNFNCSATTSFTIQVFALPVITTVVDLKQCDDDIDGFSIFNLEEAVPKIINNASSETISFFRTQPEAQSNTNPIVNTTTYVNQTVSNDSVYVRVCNTNSCFRIAKLNLIVSTTQIPLNFTRSFTECDDAVSGTNTDGIATFDFSSVTNQIQAIFPVG